MGTLITYVIAFSLVHSLLARRRSALCVSRSRCRIMEDFDLEQYIGSYSGEAYIERLTFIASQSPAHAAKALRLAIDAVKQHTTNTTRYADLVQRHNELAPSAYNLADLLVVVLVVC